MTGKERKIEGYTPWRVGNFWGKTARRSQAGMQEMNYTEVLKHFRRKLVFLLAFSFS